MSNPVKNEAVPILLQKLEQGMENQVHLQVRLEGQVQQRDLDLIQTAKKIDDLTKKLKQLGDEVSGLQKRIKELEFQIEGEVKEKALLIERLKEYRDREHLLTGQIKSTTTLKDGIQKRLDAANARIRILNKQILSERNLAKRKDAIKDLKGAKMLLEDKIDGIVNLHFLTIGLTTVTGLFSGGFIWGLVGLGTGLSVLVVPGVGLSKKSDVVNRLAETNRELTKFSKDELDEVSLHNPCVSVRK